MQKFRYWYWIAEAWLKRYTARIIVIAIILGICLSFAYIIYAFTPRPKITNDYFVEGVVGKYVRTKLPPVVMSYVSKGLVSINDQGEPVPELAESITVEDAGKTFVIKLKQGIHWHDGTELTSNDLAYNIPDVIVEKPDPYTLVFKLRDAFAPFPTLLTSPLIKVTSANDFFGVGDYRVSGLAFRETDYLTMLELESHTVSPRQITIRFYPTEQEAITALKLGEIHSLTTSNTSPLTNWNNITLYQKTTKRSYVGIYFNMKDNLVGGKDPSIRHALSMAIKIPEKEEPFLGPFSKYSWAYTPYEQKYAYNPQKARETLDKWKSTTSNTNPEITLSVRPGLTSTADQIKQYWEEIGLKVNIQVYGEGDSFQSLLTTQDLPADPDQYNLWHSTQTVTNLTGYSNVRADRDLEEARRTFERAQRLEKYQDFQKIIIEEAPVVYLHHPSTYTAIIKKYDNQAVRKLKGID